MRADLDPGVGVPAAVRPQDFRHRAACRGVDPEVFFPIAEAGPVLAAQVAAAKAVCAGCPVRAECLAWALAELPYGIAGGLTEQERHQTRTRARTDRGGRTGRAVVCRPVGGTRSEVAAAGRAAVAAGVDPRRVAVEFGVTDRTAQRWAHDLRTTTTVSTGVGRGAPAATGLPSGSPNSTNPLAGTRAVEGHRS